MAGRALRREQKSKRTPPSGDLGGIPHQGVPSSVIPSADETALPAEDSPHQAPGLKDAPEPQPAAAESAPVDTKRQIAELVRAFPNHKIAPRTNEAFAAFKIRALSAIRSAMQELAHDPSNYLPIVTQPQTIQLVDAWIDAGMPDDFTVNPEAMHGAQSPGAVERLYPVPDSPGWRKEAIQLDQPLPPPPGILLVSHGVSDKDGYEKSGKQQDAIAELAKHVKSGDFGRARAFAHKASTDLGLSDEDISHIIDTSLPSPDEAAALPHGKLLAVASAAHGTDKFPQYADLLRERFSNLDGIPPEAQNQLRSHLGALGI